MVVLLNMMALKVFKLMLISALLKLLEVASKFRMINSDKRRSLSYVCVLVSRMEASACLVF